LIDGAAPGRAASDGFQFDLADFDLADFDLADFDLADFDLADFEGRRSFSSTWSPLSEGRHNRTFFR
jgi:uncharacterized protein YjbI with pentapeptide repeats